MQTFHASSSVHSVGAAISIQRTIIVQEIRRSASRWRMIEHPACFLFLYRPSCLTLVQRSLFQAAGACRRLNQISSSLSGISFRGYPVPLCAFLFLSTGAEATLLSISRHLRPVSRVPLERSTFRAAPILSALTQRVLFGAPIARAARRVCSFVRESRNELPFVTGSTRKLLSNCKTAVGRDNHSRFAHMSRQSRDVRFYHFLSNRSHLKSESCNIFIEAVLIFFRS